jgi:two-component system sensor histidine kinase ResE
MRARGAIIGALSLLNSTAGFYTESDAELLQAFADQAAATIENARLYDKVRNYASELEQHVAHRTAELRAANESLAAAAERLKELDQLKNQFVSNVSHELRSPLTNIETYLYLLEKGKPEKREHYLATLRREAGLLHRLIEDLLNLSRMDLGHVEPAFLPLDVNRWMSQMAGDWTALFTERQLALEMLIQPDLPPALVDAGLLAVVFTNLLTNALNYTPSSGAVSLTTATRSEDEQDWVTFSVRDTGPGISSADIPHIFERFYRGQVGRDSRAPGTGLGLPICDEIVRRLNGKITLVTQQGVGSTFTVWLPRADQMVALPDLQTQISG